jgi:hypothetical protein
MITLWNDATLRYLVSAAPLRLESQFPDAKPGSLLSRKLSSRLKLAAALDIKPPETELDNTHTREYLVGTYYRRKLRDSNTSFAPKASARQQESLRPSDVPCKDCRTIETVQRIQSPFPGRGARCTQVHQVQNPTLARLHVN